MSTQRPRVPGAAPNGRIEGPVQRAQVDPDTNGDRVSNMTRAEKFEDEKKRIIESCFSKRDEDGSYSESYITHIRITEDASSPSSPPPPSSGPENKKPRVIVVAVKKSGRVRMHKAKENGNGTFSIGKTWVLDDLAAIESFTGPRAEQTNEDRSKREWANDSGVIVTVQKPYYWQAASAKEKDFFVGSLVKIFRKYTGGKLPHLIGFTTQEVSEFMAPPAQRPRTPQASTSRPGTGQSHTKQTSSDHPLVPPQVPNREPSRELKARPSNESDTGRSESEERGRRIPGQFPSSDFVRNLRPQDSATKFQATRAESPAVSSLRNDSSNPPSPLDEKSLKSLGSGPSVESFQSRQGSRDGPSTGPYQGFDRFRTNDRYSPLSRVDTPPQPTPRSPERTLPAALRPGNMQSSPPKPEQLPERRRPPISIPQYTQKISAPDSPQEFSTPSETSPPQMGSDHPQRDVPEILKDTKNVISNDYFSSNNQNQGEQGATGSTAEQGDAPKSATIKGLPSALSQLSSPATPTSPLESPPPQEVHRPGLGPMIKKKSAKDIANVFRKAAIAHNAFKPRVGGAVEKVRDEMVKTPNTPDGINGVFPAPSLLRDTSQDGLASPRPSTPLSRATNSEMSKVIPDVRVIPSPGPEATPIQVAAANTSQRSSPSPEKKTATTQNLQEDRRRKRRPSNSAKYAKALGIDHSLLEGRTGDFDSALTDYGWGEDAEIKNAFEDLQVAIHRDLAKLETGSWQGAFENSEEHKENLGKMLDDAIAQCEELDSLLTLYHVELGTLTGDVAHIEAQSQGLQVQAANQQLLYAELSNLLETISISSSELQALRDASLTEPKGIQDVETALTSLYKAMITIDPSIRRHGARPSTADGRAGTDPSTGTDMIGTEVSTMRAVQDKKARYRDESASFIRRFKQHMSVKFQEVEAQTTSSIENSGHVGLPNSASKLDLRRRDKVRLSLWIYSPLMLFAREIDLYEWEELLRMYESATKRPYQEEFKDNIATWKRMVRKPMEDQDALFTTQEKESDNIVARKLTVKRTKTLREGSRNSSGDKPQDGKLNGYEAFSGALFDMSQAIFIEQNFVVDFFHASSLNPTEFPDIVAAMPPEGRTGSALGSRILPDPDRNMAKRVQNIMDDMYASWPSEMQNLVDWMVKQDTLQGVGVMFAIESKLSDLEDTNQEFLTQTLSKIHSRLLNRFDRFIEEQIRGIEDTKVKIKKRKGVIAFIKTFPYFSASIEAMLPVPRANNYEIRQLVNETYNKINKAMFESLKFIAKESPVVMAGQKASGPTAGVDAEDKEILNYHILLIENMNHYVEEVDVRGGNPVLSEWKHRAVAEMAEHMDLYLHAIIRRPLGKLLDFIESTESLLANAPNGPTSIATRASHSRATFKKLLSTFDAKEVRRGIETLKKRVEKHFGDADDPGLSRNLVQKVLRECEDRYGSVYDRTARIVAEVYEGGLDIEYKREDVAAAFRR